MNNDLSRRGFVKGVAAAGAGTAVARYARVAGWMAAGAAPAVLSAAEAKPALLGGTPARRGAFPAWPVYGAPEEEALRGVLRSGAWFRGAGKKVAEFEAAYAKLTGARHCIATANGTSALFGAMGALEIGPGDEVVLPPYTFIATLNVILLNYALPVFVDSDPATFQLDATKLDAALTERTTAIIPVHLGGNVADLDAILAAAGKRGVPVIEDACQAPLAEWRGRKVGTLGRTGCFSFQASKNLNSGEGGAVITDDDELAEKVYAFHNNNRARKVSGYNFSYRGTRGANLRLAEWQGAMLLAQMTRLEQQSKVREQNAQYLSSRLREIPGILPAQSYAGCTRNAYHLYMFRFDREKFGGGLTRAGFMKALSAEGVPCSSGYTPLNKEGFLKEVLASKAYRRIYPAAVLNEWEERNRCPANDRLCEEAVWLTHPMLLGPRSDMDEIVAAVRKIHTHAAQLAKA
ncbi:MAG: DegT/DnrJ/EryC1/StrS family aminotransferase [Verrucomicrobia bacterium]|nr:DegT/DnrJ/EryC1/StrS family aminotransferase [Verrucomicrobiota bacterium]